LRKLYRLLGISTFFWLSVAGHWVQADDLLHIEGQLVERGTGKALAGVNIYCLSLVKPDIHIKAVTDTQGHFIVEGIPEGKFQWVVNFTGYEKLTQEDEQPTPLPMSPRKLYLEKSVYGDYETTVTGQADKRDDRTTVLTQKDFLKAPGANGDPVKATQNLPGINRPPAFSALVIIEGADPLDTSYTLENQLVPFVFHVGGFTTAVMPEAIDRVELLPTGFGPEYGQSIAGFVNLFVRSPKKDRIQGFVFADTFNAGTLVEGPITPTSSFLVTVRQSYIGAVMGAALKGNSDFNLTAVPDYKDFALVYENQLTPVDKFKITTIGSSDTLGFLFSEPVDSNPNSRGSLNFSNAFFRFFPQWTHQISPDDRLSIWTGIGRDFIAVDTGSIYYKYATTALTTRVELETKTTEYWRQYFGIDNSVNWSNQNFQLPVFYTQGGISNPISAGGSIQVAKTYVVEDLGLYWRNVLQPIDTLWTFTPGVRFDYYSFTQEAMLQPRAGVRYALNDSTSLRMAGGYYNQSPQDQQLDAAYGNPKLNSEQAWHFTAGAVRDFRQGSNLGWQVSVDGFYKYLNRLVIPTTSVVNNQPLYYSNDGMGRAYGLRTWTKADYAWVSATLSYTLSRSTRWSGSTGEAVYPYDQTHNITLMGAFTLGKNWALSGRLRYVTGNPFTPTTGGVFDSDNDNYLPIAGPFYSRRLSPFFQLDARVDKKWIFNHWMLSAYLDVQNITNQGNPEQVTYSYDYSQMAIIKGLPILPTIGFKGEF
jgi:hypothetical protein